MFSSDDEDEMFEDVMATIIPKAQSFLVPEDDVTDASSEDEYDGVTYDDDDSQERDEGEEHKVEDHVEEDGQRIKPWRTRKNRNETRTEPSVSQRITAV